MKAGDVVRFYLGSHSSQRRLIAGTLLKVNARTVLVRLPGHKIIKRKIGRDVHPDDRRLLQLGVANG